MHGQSARVMIKALIANKTPHVVLEFATRRFKASREELFDALQGELNDSHRFVVDLVGAAMLLVEISTDMDTFGSVDRLVSVSVQAITNQRVSANSGGCVKAILCSSPFV